MTQNAKPGRFCPLPPLNANTPRRNVGVCSASFQDDGGVLPG